MEKETKKYGVYLWGGHFLYLGRLEENVTEHMHHALQVIIDRKGEFDLRIDKVLVKSGGVIVGPDRRHQLVSSSDTQAHLFIDREEAVARAIARQHLGDNNFKILDGPLLRRLRRCFDVPGNYLGSCALAHEVYTKVVTELGGYSSPPRGEEAIDPRIRGVIALVQEKLFSEKLPIADIARNACLSESRLMHLFSKQIGIPLRRYVLWQRVLIAMRMIGQDKMSITDAAYAAGFSDSAHLSRTYRSMFGLTLSHCSDLSQFVQVTSCFSE